MFQTIKKFFDNIKNQTGGFTLIEIMVSVSIFIMVMVIVMGSILSVLNANQKSQSLRSVMDNVDSTMDDMTRTIRFGTEYHCGSNGLLTAPQDCGTGGTSLTVKASDGSEVTYALVSGGIARSINGAPNYLVTSPDVTITNLTFRVFGSASFLSGDYYQPQVIIVVSGYAGSKALTQSTFTIETTVSQRQLDFQ